MKFLAREEACTCGIVIVEVLRGARTEKDWAALHESLVALPQLLIDDDVVGKAARWGFQLDRRGATFSTTDLLIAAAAHGKATLVHRDGDFTRMAAEVDLKEEYVQVPCALRYCTSIRNIRWYRKPRPRSWQRRPGSGDLAQVGELVQVVLDQQFGSLALCLLAALLDQVTGHARGLLFIIELVDPTLKLLNRSRLFAARVRNTSADDRLVNFLSMHNAQHQDGVVHDSEDNPVVADAQLPVAVERLAQRLAVLVGCGGETGFDCRLDPDLEFPVEQRDINKT